MGRRDPGPGQPHGDGSRDQWQGLRFSWPDFRRGGQGVSSLRRRLATGATRLLNLPSVRLRWRESVSLGRFQNCNQPGMNNFRRHGVEDESSVLGFRQNARANSACGIPALVRMRFTSTSSGSTIRRVGNLASPFTWARISLALCSNAMPSFARPLVPVFKLRTPMIIALPVQQRRDLRFVSGQAYDFSDHDLHYTALTYSGSTAFRKKAARAVQ